jgi:polyhydroxybutyrate depolymerase
VGDGAVGRSPASVRHGVVAGCVTVAVLGGLAACTSTPGEPDASNESRVETSGIAPGTTGVVELGDRPVGLHVPKKYEPDDATGLVVFLHGLGGDAQEAMDLFGLLAASEKRGFLLAMPEGTRNPEGLQFWNATDACCDFYGDEVDDSGYLSQVIDTVAEAYAVDPHRVFVTGFSNGGFMAHRFACDHAGQVAAIVSIAGAQSADSAACNPSRAVNVLQVHGSADEVVRFAGGSIGGHPHPHPSVAQTVRHWRELDQCTASPGVTQARLDADATVPGRETRRTSWSTGCADGTEVALWTVRGGGHIPDWTPAFTEAVVGWLYAHGRTAD